MAKHIAAALLLGFGLIYACNALSVNFQINVVGVDSNLSSLTTNTVQSLVDALTKAINQTESTNAGVASALTATLNRVLGIVQNVTETTTTGLTNRLQALVNVLRDASRKINGLLTNPSILQNQSWVTVLTTLNISVSSASTTLNIVLSIVLLIG